MVFGVGVVTNEAMGAAVRAHLDRFVAAFDRYASPHVYTNFVERPTPLSESFDEVTYARLRRIKGVHDPENLFRTPRAVS